MMNVFDQMREAVNAAAKTMSAADNVAGEMARLLRGRLRKVSPWVLVQLKRELQEFDAHRKCWKEDRKQ